MAYLFLDTSNTLTLGILDKNLEWLTYLETQDKKSSSKIHKYIFDLLKENNLEIEDIQAVFGLAGPGSYTGMRVTEGIGQIFELNSIKVYSFYHYQIPRFLGVRAGVWIANAYKNEVFIYKWDNEESERLVLPEPDFKKFILEVGNEIPFYSARPHDSLVDTTALVNSTQLLKESPTKLFLQVENLNLREEVYYFRPLSDEFKVSKAK